MIRELDEYESVRADVAMAFFKYVNLFNLLERNIVLCISYIDSKSDRTTTLSQLSVLTMHNKMERLRERIAEGGFKAKDGLQEAFDEWFQFAIESKAARNRYVHGYWEVAPGSDKPVQFTANQWGADDGGASDTETMTMDEFLEMMAEMDRVFEQFGKLREKYRI